MLPVTKIPHIKLLEIIARVDFFKSFSPSQREILLQRSQVYKCKKEHFVQTEQDQNSNFYILLSGEVAILKRETNSILGHVKAGEFIGEGSFIQKRPKSAAAKALADCFVLCLDQDSLSGLPVAIKDKVKDAIIAGMTKRIQYLSNEIEALQQN